MDTRFSVQREDLYNLQMEVKQVQYAQSNHAERILRLEKRQADDTAIKSAWNSPFPGVLSGTPQQGPVQIPHNEIFDDLDEQGEQLLGSLHLGPAEEEPVRRGAASRANSVRFDESALQSSSWGGGGSHRQSGDFGPVRPGSGLLMERSLSHKSDGRHSSAGHSVHSHHSAASGRASSLGMDTNYADDDDASSSFEVPGPPVSLYVLGSVPSIVRCWLTTNYAHSTLLYADLCTGAQKSTIEYSLVVELDLVEDIQRDADGVHRIRLNVYFAEAVITQHGGRSAMSEGAVPSMTVLFEVIGFETPVLDVGQKAIRIFVGSDALRLYSSDIMFSRNLMVLNGNEGERLRVPFVRPEDDAVFRHISTSQTVPGKPKLNANATPFVLNDASPSQVAVPTTASPVLHANEDDESNRPLSPTLSEPREALVHFPDDSDAGQNTIHTMSEADKSDKDATDSEAGRKSRSATTESSQRESSTGIWGSWRQGPGGPDGFRENGPLSGYQPAPRGGRNMKILKPQKSGSSSARTGASYEPPLPPKTSNEARRKSGGGADNANTLTNANGSHRWEAKQTTAPSGSENKARSTSREKRSASGTLPRAANPVGVASAFSWMTPPNRSKPSATAE